MFAHADGAPLADARRSFKTAIRRAEVPDIRWHDLRHTFASLVASSGGSLPMIGALLGHSTPATTARYAHLMDGPLREAADEVGRIFSAASAGTARSGERPAPE